MLRLGTSGQWEFQSACFSEIHVANGRRPQSRAFRHITQPTGDAGEEDAGEDLRDHCALVVGLCRNERVLGWSSPGSTSEDDQAVSPPPTAASRMGGGSGWLARGPVILDLPPKRSARMPELVPTIRLHKSGDPKYGW